MRGPAIDPPADAGPPPRGLPECRLLGALEVRVRAKPMPLTGDRERIVLATLLTRLGQVVPTTTLVRAVWGAAPARTARNQIATCVSRLRRAFRALGSAQVIATRPNGYLLPADAVWLDAKEFDRLRALAAEAHRDGRFTTAVRVLRQAVGLWQGGALTDVSSELLQAEANRLEEARCEAMETLFEAELAVGRHREIVAELIGHVGLHPLRERARAMLMTALHRSGRTGEALSAYAEGRRLCVEELGVDPGVELRAAHAAVLAGAGDGPAPPPSQAVPAAPVDLPAAPAVFAGRSALLGCLDRLAGRVSSHRLTVAHLTGLGGIGKTAAVLRWACHAEPLFPDGRLFVPLSDAEGRGRPPVAVLRQVLWSVGDPERPLPEDEEELSGALRQMLHGRRMLLVLDDARSYRQVCRLLPGAGACMVVVTGRRPVPGLQIHHDAHLMPVDGLAHREAVELVRGVAEHRGARIDAAVADRIADACGGMPLALRVAAGRIASGPQPTDALPEGLGRPGLRLRWLSAPEADVRSCLAAAAADLDRPTLRAFATLGGTEGPFGIADAAGRLGVDPRQAEEVCTRLVEAHLLTRSGPGSGAGARHHMDVLTRLYARELLAGDPCASPQPSAASAKTS